MFRVVVEPTHQLVGTHLFEASIAFTQTMVARPPYEGVDRSTC